jgi:hypothetical protein
VKSTIFHWTLILFLLSGGLSAELLIIPGHIEFPAEEDFSSSNRQDESLMASASRKRSSRMRKVNRSTTGFLVTIARPPYMSFADRYPFPVSPAAFSHRNLHQLHEVFRI